MKLLITGARTWTDPQPIKDAIDEFLLAYDLPPNEVIFIHGDAPGADTLGGEIAYDMGMQVDSYPANWNRYGKAAGPIRNKQMVDLKPDVCIAFLVEGSRGTKNCIELAEKAGIKTIIYEG